jgi:hypothetical protein
MKSQTAVVRPIKDNMGANNGDNKAGVILVDIDTLLNGVE